MNPSPKILTPAPEAGDKAYWDFFQPYIIIKKAPFRFRLGFFCFEIASPTLLQLIEIERVDESYPSVTDRVEQFQKLLLELMEPSNLWAKMLSRRQAIVLLNRLSMEGIWLLISELVAFATIVKKKLQIIGRRRIVYNDRQKRSTGSQISSLTEETTGLIGF